MDLNFSKRFQKTKNTYFKYSTEHNDLLYVLHIFFLIFARSRKDLVIGTISKIFTHDRRGFITFFQNNNHKD